MVIDFFFKYYIILGHVLNEFDILKSYSINVLDFQVFLQFIYIFEKKLMFCLFPDNEEIKEFCMQTINYLKIDETLSKIDENQLFELCKNLKLIESKLISNNFDFMQSLIKNKYSTNGKDNYFIFIHFMQKFINCPNFPSDKVNIKNE